MTEFGGYMDGGAIPGTKEWKEFEDRCKLKEDKMKRPKLILTGHARHGKDTACSILQEYGYTSESSSYFALTEWLWPHLQGDGYATMDEAYADRVNRREWWFEAIRRINTPYETTLGSALFEKHDIYNGIRAFQELAALKDAKIANFVIWIDASKRLPPEPKTSITASMYQANHVLDNNGSLQDLRIKIGSLYRGFLRPWEARLNQGACLHCGVVRLNFNELANTYWCDSCGKVQP